MEFKEKNNAGKMETWHVKDGVKRKVIGRPKLESKLMRGFAKHPYLG